MMYESHCTLQGNSGTTRSKMAFISQPQLDESAFCGDDESEAFWTGAGMV